MGNPYRELLNVPGARIFVSAGFVGRMSMSMIGIAIVLLVSAVTGSYGIAGAVSATCALAYAAASPVVGRLADRLGQQRVLVPLTLANAASMTLLVLCAQLKFPTWTLFPAAAMAGATSPGLGAMVRARWINILRDVPDGPGRGIGVHTAFSFESVLDELIFITGPMLVTLLATEVHPAGGVVAAGVFTLIGCLTLAAQRGSQPPPRPQGRGETSRSAVTIPGVIVVSLVFLLMGAVFGAIDVSAIAFAEEEGHRGLAGVLLAVYALGSCSAGLWYGARHWRSPLSRRFEIGLVLLVAGLVPLTLISQLQLMMAVIFFSGLAISPTIISGYGLIEHMVPRHQLTEGLALVSTSVGVGVAIGASAAGRLVDSYGSGGAFFFPLGAGLVAVVVGLAGRSPLSKHEFPSR